MTVVLLAGGGGGARLARGLQGVLASGELTVVANVGDDVEVLGLHVSPDLDGVLYALSGLLDDERGWGREGESWDALASAASWGGEDWFRLGDLDLGLHLVRTKALREGRPLSGVTAQLARCAGLATALLPATDDQLRTHVLTAAGTLAFQDWYVRRSHRDEVDGVVYEGAESATPAPGVLDALEAASALLIAPSNPYLSIGPILAVEQIRSALASRRMRCVAVSPLVGGKAVTGPLDRMLLRMAGGSSVAHLTALYGDLVDVLVVDEADAGEAASVELASAPVLMPDLDAERRLAHRVLEVACG